MDAAGLNAYVSEVGVISMDAKRVERLEEEFRRIHTTFQVYPGVRATAEDIQQRSGGCRLICPTASAVGILMAHRRLWEYMVKKSLPSMAIFEDDVRFTSDFLEVFPKAYKELPSEGWDLVYLGCFSCHGMSLLDSLASGFKTTQRYSAHLSIPPIMFGMEAYIVSLAGARKLLERTAHIPLFSTGHIDALISRNAKHITYYSITPTIAYQDGGDDSTNRAAVPRLLNTATRVRIHPGIPKDTRTLDWLLSLRLYTVLGMPINGWWFVCALVGLLSPTPWVWLGLIVYLLIEAVMFGVAGEAIGYGALIVACLLGVGLRKLIARLVRVNG